MNEEILVAAEGEAASRIDGDPHSDTFITVENYPRWLEKKIEKGYTIQFITPYKTSWGWGDGRRERTIILRLLRLTPPQSHVNDILSREGAEEVGQ